MTEPVQVLTAPQREVLRALVDTAVPSLPVDDDPHGFWARPGTAVGVDVALETAMADMTEADRTGIGQLLDGLAMLGFQHQGRKTREGMLATASALAPEAQIALATLRGASCMLAHSLPDESGRNPFWPQYGYPGPVSHPADRRAVHHAARPERRRGPRGRRRGRRQRRGRRHHRRRAGDAGQARRRARDGPRDQRARLPPARGRGQPDDDVPRRHRRLRRRQRRPARRRDARRRHHHQLAQLRAAQRRGAPRVGRGARPGRRRLPRVRPAPRGGARAHEGATTAARTRTARTSASPRAPRSSAGRCTPRCATSTRRPTTRWPPGTRSSATRPARRCRR